MPPPRGGYLGTALWISALCIAGTAAGQQAPSEEDPWSLLRPLEGTWEASIAGRLGSGVGIRTYEFIFDERFLLVRHSSVRLPQPESPKGDHHRELGVFSHDRTRGAIIYRQFIVEGFVLRYVCDIDTGERLIVCTTESVENGEGLRARETIRLTSDHSFEETFELAEAGEELAVLFTNSWTRRPTLE